MKISDIIVDIIAGGIISWLFYKWTRPRETIVNKPVVQTISLVHLRIPKTISPGDLKSILDKVKPIKIIPSKSPLGVWLKWQPMSIETPIGEISYSLPDKFIKLKNLDEVRKAVASSIVNVQDKGMYWDISLSITV